MTKTTTHITDATDAASRAATILRQYRRELGDLVDDLVGWGAPGECINVVVGGAERRMRERLAVLGLTEGDAVELLRDRTSPRWVHFNV